jgi:hypothetical protein
LIACTVSSRARKLVAPERKLLRGTFSVSPEVVPEPTQRNAMAVPRTGPVPSPRHWSNPLTQGSRERVATTPLRWATSAR